MAKIALGTWAWGAGAFGGDAVFGSKTDEKHQPMDERRQGRFSGVDGGSGSGLSRDETQHLLNHSVKIAKFRHLLVTLPSILNCIYEKNKLYFGSSHVDGVGCGDGSAGIKGVSHKGDFTRIVGKNLQGTWR